MEFTYITTNVTNLSLVELEAFKAMTLVLIWVNTLFSGRTSVAFEGLVDVVTPQYTVELNRFELKAFQSSDATPPGTKTLAYYEHSQIKDEKSFITMMPGANVIKLLWP